MKLKIRNILKKYRLPIIVVLSVLVVGVIATIMFLMQSPTQSIKEFKNSYYSFKYDSTWKIASEKDKTIKLKHNNGSTIAIGIIELQDDYKYSTIDEILDELLYDLEAQNKEYKLISKKEDSITKNDYDGYKILYENGESQAMVVIGKKTDQFLVFTYEAKNDDFDILLDSVHYIIHNFDTIEQSFNLSYRLNVDTQNIKYVESKEVKDLLNQTSQYEIAYKNYYVKYSIPSVFQSNKVDSSSGYFKFQELENGSITMSVNIYNKNIYEHLDYENSVNVYNEFAWYKTDEDYSKFTESVNKFSSEYESYIYKNSYYYDKATSYDEDLNHSYSSQLNENVVMMYGLDRNHLLLIKISSSKVGIPKELIDMIKIDFSENYSSYITSKKENGYLVGELKRLKDYASDEIEEIKLKVPEKYKEIDKETNIYQSRYYSLNYNENLELYDYEVNFFLTPKISSLENEIKYINMSFTEPYGDYKYLAYVGSRKINDKSFQIYEGGFTDLSGIMFTSLNRTKYYVDVKVLFYELPTGGFLAIRVDGNGVLIDNAILNDLTNFEI